MRVFAKVLERYPDVTWVFWRKDIEPTFSQPTTHIFRTKSTEMPHIRLADYPKRLPSVDERILAEIDDIDRYFEQTEEAEVDSTGMLSETETDDQIPTLTRSDTLHLTRKLFSADFGSVRNSIDVTKLRKGKYSRVTRTYSLGSQKSEELEAIRRRSEGRSLSIGHKSDNFEQVKSRLKDYSSVQEGQAEETRVRNRSNGTVCEMMPEEDQVKFGCWARKLSFKRSGTKEVTSA